MEFVQGVVSILGAIHASVVALAAVLVIGPMALFVINRANKLADRRNAVYQRLEQEKALEQMRLSAMKEIDGQKRLSRSDQE